MGGYKNIKPEEGKWFSKDYQPKRYRGKSWKTILAEKCNNNDKELVKRAEIVDDKGNPTGKFVDVLIASTPQEKIVRALVQKAGKGDLKAIEMLMDRMDGKPTATTEVIDKTPRLSAEEQKEQFNKLMEQIKEEGIE